MLLFHIDLPEIHHLLDHDKGKQETEAYHHRDGFPVIRNGKDDTGQFDQASDQETEKTDKGIPVFSDISAREINRQCSDAHSSQDHQDQIGHIDQIIERYDPGKMQERPDHGIQDGDHYRNRHTPVRPAALHHRQIHPQGQGDHQAEHKTQQPVYVIHSKQQRKQS